MKKNSIYSILRISALFTVAFSLNIYSYFSFKGQIICAQTERPLDSVRIASMTTDYLTYSQDNGFFNYTYDLSVDTLKKETSSNTASNYSVTVSINGNTEKFFSKSSEPPELALFDLFGRCVDRQKIKLENTTLPEQKLPPGIYILKINEEPSASIVVSSHRSCLFYDSKHSSVVYKSAAIPENDTLVFYRQGYTVMKMCNSDIRKTGVIKLYKKKWVASDNHSHTVLTDGGYILDSILAHSFKSERLDVYVNSEHGGAFDTDTADLPIINDPYQKTVAPFDTNDNVPRWYTLVNYSWPKVLNMRKKYPEKTILLGLEWNCPGHEHASVGFTDDADQPSAISQFEYKFDFNDYNTNLPDIDKHRSYKHENAVLAVKWLQEKYKYKSYFFINHPSREADGQYRVEHFRDFNNTGPDVFLGFEGMPGHQKGRIRGNYGQHPEVRNRTWGGADYILAKVGGLWDALLGEGRHVRTIVNSDFHGTDVDFWPGTYEKTKTAVTGSTGRDWLDGLRAGEIFIAHGDLVSELDFSIDDGVTCASMGHDLYTKENELLLTIRFKSPSVNYHGDSVRVDHIDLISGRITGLISPSDSSSYTKSTNSSTKVARRFSSKDWTVENGYKVIRTHISCSSSKYFRLRGTNLAVGTKDEVDKDGNPLMDQDDTNNSAAAWRDLWFYSNPVFVYRK